MHKIWELDLIQRISIFKTMYVTELCMVKGAIQVQATDQRILI
jgi:hypothetical protein